jgi:hypothetical protein
MILRNSPAPQRPNRQSLSFEESFLVQDVEPGHVGEEAASNDIMLWKAYPSKEDDISFTYAQKREVHSLQRHPAL